MRLLIRLAGGTGAPLDLHLELADDVTVGELADHLAHISGAGTGLTLEVTRTDRGVHTLDRAGAVLSAGPRSGSAVRLVDSAPTVPAGPPRSPVSLVEPGRTPEPLPYGTYRLDEATIHVGDRVAISATGGAGPSVNGRRVLGADPLGCGDLVWTGRRTVEVRIDGALAPPPPSGPTEPVRRSAELREEHPPGTIELPTPPQHVRPPGFPVLSAAVPLLMGAGLWAITRSAASAVFVLFSFVFVVASGLESRREARAEARFREAEFRQAFADRAGAVASQRRLEQHRRRQGAPAVRELLDVVEQRGGRIWERKVGEGAESLRVRLGTAQQEPGDRVVVPDTGRRDLTEELQRYAEEVATSLLPVVVDLDRTNGLAIVGTDDLPTSVARSVVVQLATLVGPDELGIRILTAPSREEAWKWCEWLPHRHSSDDVARTLLVVDGGDPAAAAEIVRSAGEGQVRVLWLSPTSSGLPLGIAAVLMAPADRPARLELLEGGVVTSRIHDIEVEDLTADEVLPLARSLAPLTPSPQVSFDHDHVGPTGAALPPRVSLSEVTGPLDPTAVLDRWAASAHAGTLGAPVGRVPGGTLALDLREDGPHALVAGTTGSGKSELLRTLVASLALHNGPDRLTFLLVDYKGGAAFGPLTELPHTVGLITDLTEHLATRALRSLRAEVRRREEMLSRLGVSDVVDLDATGVDRIPALVVMVDEFATLARELPEFVEGLVDVAQRGRSLGVHLVLATQRPAGVITDAIRANTGLRLALRVADDDDSRDVIDGPLAARLPRDMPGRAVLRVGPERTTVAQVAWSGAELRHRDRITCRSLGTSAWLLPSGPHGTADPPSASGPTELDAAVAAARRCAVDTGTAEPRRPWIDPLPDQLDLAAITEPCRGGRISIGLVDRPEHQRRDLLQVDLERDAGVLVLGANGSGRSTLLHTITAALERDDQPVQVHAIDAGHALAPLAGSAIVGDVIAAHDTERVLRLLRATVADLVRRSERRPGEPDAADAVRRVVMIDGFATFEEIHERTNRGEAMDLVGRIARDGRSVGIHLAVTALRRSEVPAQLAASLGCRLHLRCSSEDDAVMSGLDASAADPELPPGRGVVGAVEFQVAVPDGFARSRAHGSCAAEPVPALPRHISLAELLTAAPRKDDPWRVPVGLDADRLGTTHLDLRHHHVLVAGPPRSGVSTTLATIAAGLDASYLLTTREPVLPQAWTRVERWSSGDWAALVDLACASANSGERTLLAIDQLPDVLDDPAAHEFQAVLSELVGNGTSTPLRLAVGGEADAMHRCYSDAVTRIRSGRTGVLLQPDGDLHPGLLHASLPLRDELPRCAGRGWVLAPGTAVPVQVARP